MLAQSASSVATTYLGSNRHLRGSKLATLCILNGHDNAQHTHYHVLLLSVAFHLIQLHYYTAHRVPTTLITRSLHVTPTSPPSPCTRPKLTTTRNPAAARADDGDLRRRRYSQHAGYEHGSYLSSRGLQLSPPLGHDSLPGSPIDEPLPVLPLGIDI